MNRQRTTQTAWALLAGSMLFSGTSAATFVSPDGGGSEDSLQEILDNITTDPAGNSSVTVSDQTHQVASDEVWEPLTEGEESSATIIIELAGYEGTNRFGIYDAADSGKKVEFVDGGDDESSPTVSFKIDNGAVSLNGGATVETFAGNHFGFYLDVPQEGTTFYSETDRNDDNFDHMVAYEGRATDPDQLDLNRYSYMEYPHLEDWEANEYILAWEDLTGGGDEDYNDFVAFVQKVQPVPLPAAIWLMGSALVLLAGIRRRAAAKARVFTG